MAHAGAGAAMPGAGIPAGPPLNRVGQITTLTQAIDHNNLLQGEDHVTVRQASWAHACSNFLLCDLADPFNGIVHQALRGFAFFEDEECTKQTTIIVVVCDVQSNCLCKSEISKIMILRPNCPPCREFWLGVLIVIC